MLVAIGISGFCALAAEVVWARVLSLLLGATVYTFSIILAVFLTGLGSGAAWVRRSHATSPVRASTWRAVSFFKSPPSRGRLTRLRSRCRIGRWTIHSSPRRWQNSNSISCAAPGRSCRRRYSGARAFRSRSPHFPARERMPARVVGRAYAANTLGAIAGAVLASMCLIPALGTQQTQIVLIAASLASAALAFQPQRAREWEIAGAAAGSGNLPRLPRAENSVATRRVWTANRHQRLRGRAIFFGEGMNSSVAVSRNGRWRTIFPRQRQDRSLEPRARTCGCNACSVISRRYCIRIRSSVLIVGCGAGVTSGSFVLHPSIERIVICDIEPLIPKVVATHFRHREPQRDPRSARRDRLRRRPALHRNHTREIRYDHVGPNSPVGQRLRGALLAGIFRALPATTESGGLVTQWVPLYESDRPVVQSEIATFFSVFPAWHNLGER